jgi:acyl-CoA dehydrogenase
MPISITVEGANILTRTLMVFGQGAIRCHPYALREIEALENGDLNEFDRAFWGHVGHVGQTRRARSG